MYMYWQIFVFLGSWRYAFDILSSVAILTNTALIAMQPSVREYFSSYTDVEYILIFVVAEVCLFVYDFNKFLFMRHVFFLTLQHILLALKLIISFAIPNTPYEIQIAKIKNLYESNQALRNEVRRIDSKIDFYVFLFSYLETAKSIASSIISSKILNGLFN